MPNRTTGTAASLAQPTLFHGSLNFDFELRDALSKAIESSALSRVQIAARMADLSASKVSEAMIDSWTAPSRGKWNFPVRLALAFDVVTDSTCVLELLARREGRKVLTTEEALDAELGALARQEAEITRRRTDLLAAISAARASQ
jgi:hypothetical protein